jgi:glutathione synthase/RimK-type ligase-like ATP-grasp enzyme
MSTTNLMNTTSLNLAAVQAEINSQYASMTAGRKAQFTIALKAAGLPAPQQAVVSSRFGAVIATIAAMPESDRQAAVNGQYESLVKAADKASFSKALKSAGLPMPAKKQAVVMSESKRLVASLQAMLAAAAEQPAAEQPAAKPVKTAKK